MTHTQPGSGEPSDARPDARADPDAARPAAARAVVPEPDGAEIAAFWQLARGRAGLGRLAVLVGPGATASVPPPAGAFGDTPRLADELLALVLAGNKTATSAAVWEYADAGQPLPARGDLSIVLDGRGHPRALVRTTAVRVARLADVDADHAAAEGEGDRSPAAWRREHESRLRQAAAAGGREVSGDTEMVLERFELRFPARTGRRTPTGAPGR